MATKTVKACYSGFSEITTRPLLQYDYGQVLLITNMDLPQAYEVIFSNTKNGAGKSQIGDEDGVSIPDEYLTTGLPVYAKLFLHEGQDDGEGVLTITIPVTKSTYDSTDPPTPVEQSAITQAIAALDDAVRETGENVTLSAGYASEAEDARDTILNMSATASTLPAGSGATASFDHDTGTLSLGIPKGDKGDPGDPGTPGAPGATPNISVAATALPSSDDPTATRSGTDLNPLITFGIPAGKDGTDGDDGFSPVVTVSAITGGHEVFIQDATQTQTFDVMDGSVQPDEVYPQLTSGNAQELDSDLYTVDQTPYLLRATPSGATRERDTIVGGSIVWNQLVNTSDTSITVTSGHKCASKINGTWAVASSNGSAISVTGGTDMVHDLTQMFGTTIADYLYALGSSTAIAKLRAMGYIDDVYHAYDAGTMKHVSGVSAHKMRDADNNVIATYPLDDSLTLRGVPKVVGGEIVYDGDEYSADGVVKRKYGIVDLGSLTWTYSGGFFRTTSLNSVIKKPANQNTVATIVCEKYVAMTWNAISNTDNMCCAVGPTTSPIIFVNTAYTDKNAFKSAMSGVYLVYELATPTQESADPFATPQVVDPYGTEEYVTTGIPVGHYTEIPVSQKGKLDAMPNSLFYTETSMKATRSYTINQLISVKGQLYKVLTSIANGATLTVGTNVQAVSLGDIITALLNG